MLKLLFAGLLAWLPLAHAAEPLPPEQAFRFSARTIDATSIEARWTIHKDYYLYRDKLKFAVTGAELGAVELPRGKMKDDDLFGKVEVFRNELIVRLPVKTAGAASQPASVELNAQSQGCWDGGICYPPQKHAAKLELPAAVSAPAPTPQAATPAPAQSAETPAQNSTPQAEDSRIAQLIGDADIGVVLATFFGFGLLLAFTPCMFPMIPILSGIIVKHGHAVTHGRAFVLSLAYVIGMALTYALVGVAAGLSGTLLSSALQNVWVLGGFALVFVALALSMFGFYELQLPAALQSRISDTANRQGGSLPAIALMGALSALIVGPCVAAPLAGALLYIAKTGDALLGGVALFVLALGMGAPLLLVGAFSRSLLPRSGPWMEGVNRFFGVVMLATALWFVAPVLPQWLAMLGWAALLIVPAIYLHALDPLPPNAHGWHRFGKGLGVISLLAGAAMLAGVLGGARDPLQPLGFLRGASAASSANAIAVSPTPTFEKIASVAELDARLATAKASGQTVMLDFYADWCVSCKEMERFTFTDPAVAAAMSRMVLLKADVTANSEAHQALLKRFDLFGPPGIIFFRDGRELAGQRVIGFQPAAAFLAALERAQKAV